MEKLEFFTRVEKNIEPGNKQTCNCRKNVEKQDEKNENFNNHNQDCGLSFITSQSVETVTITTTETIKLGVEKYNKHKNKKGKSEELIESSSVGGGSTGANAFNLSTANNIQSSDATSANSTPSNEKTVADTRLPSRTLTLPVDDKVQTLSPSFTAGSQNKIKISQVSTNSDCCSCSNHVSNHDASRTGYSDGNHKKKNKENENKNVKTGDKRNHNNNLNDDKEIQTKKDNCCGVNNRKVVKENNDDDNVNNNESTDELWLENWTAKEEKLNNDGEIVKNDFQNSESDKNYIENYFCPVSYTNNDQIISNKCD